MSPADDTFMSGSLDNSVRLWDLRTPNCSGIMQVQGKPVCWNSLTLDLSEIVKPRNE